MPQNGRSGWPRTAPLWLALVTAGWLAGGCVTSPNSGARRQLQLVAGNRQEGPAGAELPIELKVKAVPAAGGVEVSWLVVDGGGVASPATSVTDLDGDATTRWILGPVLGNQHIEAGCADCSNTRFTATATAPAPGSGKTWTGAVSNHWDNPANWSPGGVPTATDDVLVRAATPFQPQLSALAQVRDLTGEPGSVLCLCGFNLEVHGDFDWAGTSPPSFGEVLLAGSSGSVRGKANAITVIGTYTVNGQLTLVNDLVIEPGELIVGGNIVNLDDLTVGLPGAAGSGRLTMTSRGGQVLAAGNVTFHGGDESGSLDAGLLRVGKDFRQLVGTRSFVASGSHRTAFTAGSHLIQVFSDQTRFQDLDVSAVTGTVTIGNPIIANGVLISSPAAGNPQLSNPAGFGGSLTVGGVNVTHLTVSGLPLTVSEGPLTAFSNVTFVNYLTGAIQLNVRHPGLPASFTFDNLSFGTVPVAGLYLRAEDTDAGPGDPGTLTLTVTNSTPATGAPFVQTSNGAVVNW